MLRGRSRRVGNDSNAATRYAGRPMIRLIECYVLDVIGELPADQREALEAMTPDLIDRFGADASDWRQLVATQMGFPPELRSELERAWKANTEEASARGLSLDPQLWVQAVVDDAEFT